MRGTGRVVIVDDEPNALKVLSLILSKEGYDVLQAWDVEGGLRIIRSEDVDAVITDLKMPGTDGAEFFEYLNNRHPDIPVIFLTAYGTVESAVHAMISGAFYYFIKPPDYRKFKEVLAEAIDLRRLKKELEYPRMGISAGGNLPILGQTPDMLKIFETIRAVKDTRSSVLILGETGTGKELIARALHYNSERKDKPFIAVNCAAMPGELMESELFGYEKGAFTGAVSRRLGKFEEARGGTVFLDEIGELKLSLQAKLLRVLEAREIERIGSNMKIPVDFKLVSSTNRDLEEDVHCGNFRKDLYYRINVIKIPVVPLRERKEDIHLLVSQFVNEFCMRENKVLSVSERVRAVFQDYHWPGNVRQLKNVMERAVVLAKGGAITSRELPDELMAVAGGEEADGRTLWELQIQAVRAALKNSRGNKSKAARALGISRKAFYRRLRELDSLGEPSFMA